MTYYEIRVSKDELELIKYCLFRTINRPKVEQPSIVSQMKVLAYKLSTLIPWSDKP